jgi:anti-sigma B factor antagonist
MEYLFGTIVPQKNGCQSLGSLRHCEVGLLTGRDAGRTMDRITAWEAHLGIQLKSHEVRGELMLDLSGRLTILDQTLRDAMRQFLAAGYRQFIFKMNEVSYIDSCGLGELISVYTSVRRSGGNLRLLTPSEKVRELLHISRLDTVFEILDDATPFADSANSTTSGR